MLFLALLGCPRSDDGPPPGDDDDDDDDVTTGYCDGLDDGGHCDGLSAVQCLGGEIADTEVCADACVDGACFTCGTASVSNEGPLRLVTDPGGSGSRWALVPLEVTGSATLTLDGPFEALDADDEPLTGEIADLTLWLRATADGEGTLTLAPIEGCVGDPVVVALRSGPAPRLAGTVLPGPPGFDDSGDLFLSGRPLAVDVPVARFPELEGLAFDAWLVPHREDWTDGTLSGVGAIGPIAGQVGIPVDVGAAPEALPFSSWDVVADLDRDGLLGPGDLARGVGSPAILVAGDLTAPGPHPIDQADASGGGAFLEQRIYWPTDLDQLDPVPLVVLSHGNGHDYRWYDYLGQHLASHGYVFMSHSNNTAPGPVAASRTTISNTDALIGALPTFQGGFLDGEIDLQSIVWIGHSRGGEGIVLAWQDLLSGQQSADNFGALDVVLLSSIAPTLFEGPQQADPGETPFHLIAGSADGDVTGGVEQGLTQYFRMFQGATSQKFVTYVEGASHNDFNCCGFDDAQLQDGRPLIGRPTSLAISKVMHLALLEAHFHDRPALRELFVRSPLTTRPFGPNVRIASMYEAAEGDTRVIEDFQTEPDPLVSSSGGAMSTDAANPFIGDLDDGNSTLAWGAGDAMNGMSWVHGNDSRPDKGLVFDWSDGDDVSLVLDLVAGDRDLTGWDSLMFRASQGTRHPETVTLGADLTFAVELEDGAGVVALVPLAPFSAIPQPYSRGGSGGGRGWVNEFQTVRLPLSAFTRVAPGFDTADVRTIRFRFGAAHGAAQGRLGLDDILFARELP